jgi:polyisoprenoid-binding protein YceI
MKAAQMSPRPALPFLIAAVALTLLAVPSAHATALDVKASGEKTFYVNPRAGNSQITDISRSTLEDFTTVANQVKGQWQLDPKNLEAMHGHFSLKVDDLHTGIALRDHDLRGPDWFDAAKYPDVVVDITHASDVQKTRPNTAKMKLIGTLSMHGQTKPVEIAATLAYLDESPMTEKLVRGDVVRVRAEFPVKLSEFGITGPPESAVIGVKVSDEQNVQVTIFGATERPPEELNIDVVPTPGPPVKPKPPKPPGGAKP